MLVGRDDECARIDELVVGARAGRSGVMVVLGEPGIGKSALLAYAGRQGADMTRLAAQGYESESQIPFAGLADLLRPLHRWLDALPAPQAGALAGALALGPPVRGDRFTVCAATLSLLAAGAESGPMLALVDDAHWLDASTAEALLFAARRLHSEGVALLLAARPDGDAADYAGLDQLWLSGVDPASARRLLSDQHVALADEVVQQIYTTTAGNPMGLKEIAELLGDATPAYVATPGEPLPVGATLQRVLRRQIDALPPATQDALLVVAAGESAGLDVVTIALDNLDVDVAAFEPAERARVVAFSDGRMGFRHPLLRSVLYHGASVAARSAAHLALAHAFDAVADGRAAEQRAWHLAAGTLVPDAAVAPVVADAGRRALARGAYPAAAQAFEHAARLSPAPGERAAHLLWAARCWRGAGTTDRVEELLRQALQLTDDPRVTAEIQHLRGFVEMWRHAPASAKRLLVAEAAKVEAADPGRATFLLVDAAISCFMTGELREGLTLAQRAHDVSAASEQTPQMAASVVLAVAQGLRGQRDEARSLLHACTEWLDQATGLQRAQARMFAALAWTWLEHHREARRLLDRLIATCRESSALGVLPYALGVRSSLDFRTGRWSSAHAGAAESVTLASETGQRNAYGRYFLAQVEAVQGREAECRANVAAADELAARDGIDCMPIYTASVLGLQALGHGRNDEAIEDLEQVAALAVTHGLDEPTVIQWGPDLVEAYVRAGRSDAAAATLDRFTPSPHAPDRVWAHAAAARCRGLLAEDGDMQDAFADALRWHDRTSAPFERARTLLCFGEQLRRHRHRSESRQQLRAALQIFEQLGAAPWAERTRAELRASGETTRQRAASTPHDLTAQELQVALVVADGVTNQEAAARLFLSPKTIEYHLTNVYRKTGVGSRHELAEVIAEDDRSAAAG